MLNQLINDIVFAVKNSNLFKLTKKVNKNKKIIKINFICNHFHQKLKYLFHQKYPKKINIRYFPKL